MQLVEQGKRQAGQWKSAMAPRFQLPGNTSQVPEEQTHTGWQEALYSEAQNEPRCPAVEQWLLSSEAEMLTQPQSPKFGRMWPQN